MPETSPNPEPAPDAGSDANSGDNPHCFRGRIGADPASGFYAAPHRYELYLSPSCPSCLRIAITHGLLRLDDTVTLTMLPASAEGSDGADGPDGRGDGDTGSTPTGSTATITGSGAGAALRAAYEATWHGHQGPAAVPALTDRWTGRVVSNHAPDIVRDLALRFSGGGPVLYPRGAEEEIAALTALLDTDLTEAAQRAGRSGGDRGQREEALATLLGALGTLEERLVRGPYLLGDELTAADVHLWVALLELDTVHRWHLDAAAVHRVAAHQRLWTYARTLLREEAFRAPLDTGAIERGHHRRCRGQEAAGAAVQIIDWNSEPEADPGPGPDPDSRSHDGSARTGPASRPAHSSIPERSTPATM